MRFPDCLAHLVFVNAALGHSAYRVVFEDHRLFVGPHLRDTLVRAAANSHVHYTLSLLMADVPVGCEAPGSPWTLQSGWENPKMGVRGGGGGG
jgi:hypothetical protein